MKTFKVKLSINVQAMDEDNVEYWIDEFIMPGLKELVFDEKHMENGTIEVEIEEMKD